MRLPFGVIDSGIFGTIDICMTLTDLPNALPVPASGTGNVCMYMYLDRYVRTYIDIQPLATRNHPSIKALARPASPTHRIRRKKT
jgi:hypothetical protein